MSTLLNLVRIGAVGSIIIAHILQFMGHPWGDVGWFLDMYRTGLGNFAVSVTIILSGCVLAMRYEKVPSWPKFMWKRLKRLYPTYWVILAIAIATSLVMPWPRDYAVSDLLHSITGTHAFVGQVGGPWLPTSWFMGVIVSLYAVFPILNKEMRRQPRALLLLCFLISTISRWWLGGGVWIGMSPVKFSLLCRVFEFSLGIWIGQVVPSRWWNCLNGSRWDEGIARLAAWSFPAFLWHTILLDLMR